MKSEFFSRYYDAGRDSQIVPFRVRSLGYNHCASGFSFDKMLKMHPKDHRFAGKSGRVLSTLSIGHVTRGGGRFISNESGVVPIRTNSILVVFPGIRHSLRYDGDTGWDGEWVEMHPEEAQPILYAAGITPANPCRQFKGLASLSHRYHDLFELARKDAPPAVSLAAAAYRVLAEVVAVWHFGASRSNIADLPDETMEKACRELSGEDGRFLKVDQAARVAGLSDSRFRTVFRECFGVSPKKFQMGKRIERCCQMLKTTRMSISAIAEANGFESLYVFSRQFRRSIGRSPQEYRAANSRK